MVLIMINNDFFNFEMVPMNDIIVASLAIFGGLSGGVLLLFVGGVRLSQTGFFKRISLMDTQAQSEGYTSNFNNTGDLIGKTGTAYTVLRPSGKIMIEDQIYDAFSRGDYIEKGDTVKVLEIEGSTLKVRKVTA
jgi:membrane-bound serine protease (ClpP class)